MESGFKIPFNRLNHVTVSAPAGEHERVRAFYGGVLGLTELERPEQLRAVFDIIWFECGGIQIHVDLSPLGFVPGGNRHFAMEVSDIAKVRQHLEANGVPIREAVPVPGKVWFYALDPFENVIEFLEFK